MCKVKELFSKGYMPNESIYDGGQKVDEWLPGSRKWGATAKRHSKVLE